MRKETQENCALGMETGNLLQNHGGVAGRDLLTAWIIKLN